MSKPGDQQKGPPTHAEGQHGNKTHARFTEQLQDAPREEPAAERGEGDPASMAFDGKHRLLEDRQQHDEAEKNSEHNQLYRDRQRGRADEGP